MPLSRYDVACPFCGLLCDDLSIDQTSTGLAVTDKGCARAREGFARPAQADASCLIDGHLASVDEAIEHAAALLRQATQPLFVSGGADVASMRALLDLAEHCDAVVDHRNEGVMRNLRVVQDQGWITTTLTEVRNRADLILCIGTGVTGQFPRFFERFARAGGLVDASRPAPRLVFLGAAPPEGMDASHLDLAPDRLFAAIELLRALTAGKRPSRLPADLSELHAAVHASSYAVVVWSAATLPADGGDLLIQALCAWIKSLNQHTRVCGLPLGGSDGDLTALQTTLWQTGLPLRTRLGKRGPEHDSRRFAARHMLDQGRADLLLYIAEIDPSALPPATALPSIVLGAASMTPPPCQVFVPVATPGLHRTGHLFRTDGVVAIPLRALAANRWHSTAEILGRIAIHLDSVRS